MTTCLDCGRHRPNDEEWDDSGYGGAPVYERGWCLVEHDDHYSSATNECRGLTIERLRAQLKSATELEIRAHESRALLQKLAKYVREDCLGAMAGSARLAKLSLQVDDYLKRTHDPRSILRAPPSRPK